MANSQSNSNNEGVCEKIYKSVWHVSPRPNSPKPNKRTPRTRASTSEVPIIFNTPTKNEVLKVASKMEPVETRVEPSYEPIPSSGTVPEKAKAEEIVFKPVNALYEGEIKPKLIGTSDDFSNYIRRAKAKIRTTSSIGNNGERESVVRLDSIEVKASDYIQRTKMKIRAMSGIGGRKISIK